MRRSFYFTKGSVHFIRKSVYFTRVTGPPTKDERRRRGQTASAMALFLRPPPPLLTFLLHIGGPPSKMWTDLLVKRIDLQTDLFVTATSKVDRPLSKMVRPLRNVDRPPIHHACVLFLTLITRHNMLVPPQLIKLFLHM